MSSPAKSSFPPSPTRDDPLAQLRHEVDKLTERLDFMAPMLSLLKFTHDVVQRVECEASVQLLRLRNAKVTGPASTDAGDASEDQGMVDTAKWLHTLTDLVMGLQSGSKQPSGDAQALTPESSLRASSPLQRVSIRTPPVETRQLRPLPKGTGKGGGGGHGSAASAVSAASGTSASSGGSGGAGSFVVRGADPSRAGGLDSTLEFGGLALGRGTWANAYRQAKGARRDALRLLCSTGIVTERELADDLTVISEEHVEECVSIAWEMLRRWPAERGPPPREEAKTFFEGRLAAMYMRRAPAPFGGR